jgi:hypothetical protein
MLAMYYIDTSSNVPFPDIHGPLVLTMLLLIKNQQMLKWSAALSNRVRCVSAFTMCDSFLARATQRENLIALPAQEVATCDAKMFSTGIRSAKPEFSNRG